MPTHADRRRHWGRPTWVRPAALLVALLLLGPALAVAPTAARVQPASPLAAATPDQGLALPDLALLPTEQLLLTHAPLSGRRQLRFSTTIANLGPAPLELLGEPDPAAGTIRIRQRLLGPTGPVEREVGAFVFDAAHGHWHVDALVVTELWTLTPAGARDRLVASTGKTSFCLTDAWRRDPAPAADPAEPVFRYCVPDRQGLSPGWADRYDATLPGQSLDVTDLPDGRYALRTRLDPDRLLLDADPANNEQTTLLDLGRDQILPAPP